MTNSEYDKAYEAALIDEAEDRSLAFVCDFDSICGIRVNPLTLRIYERLKLAKSPFVVGGTVEYYHIAQFIWFVSPDFDSDAEKRQTWMELHADLDIEKAFADINEYMDRAFLDDIRGGSKSRPLLSLSGALCFEMSEEPFGWHWKATMCEPLAVIFQLLKAKEMRAGRGRTNKRSDKLTCDWLAAKNAKNKAERAAKINKQVSEIRDEPKENNG